MLDVCVVGSANLDLVARTPRLPGPGETVLGRSYAEHPGGKGLNQAVAAARSGASVAFVGTIGDDDAGRRLVATARGDGIDTTAVVIDDVEPTGRAMISVDDRAENSIVVIPGANARSSPPEVPHATVVLAQLEVPQEVVNSAFEAARSQGAITVLNPAPAATLQTSLLARCDVIVPNEHEVELLGGVEALHAAGVGIVIVTRGPDGADVSDRRDGPVTWTQPSWSVDVVDTTGAGDAFCGGLAARLAAGDGLADAVRWAAAAGALAATMPGAVPSLPHADAIRRLLSPG
jgi:ribokinase